MIIVYYDIALVALLRTLLAIGLRNLIFTYSYHSKSRHKRGETSASPPR